MCAFSTPPSSAWTHASSFGRIPPLTLASRSRTSAAFAVEIRCPSSSSHASTSVRKTTLYARIASAIAPAAVSALTL
jgi:hypothetical protein